MDEGGAMLWGRVTYEKRPSASSISIYRHLKSHPKTD